MEKLILNDDPAGRFDCTDEEGSEYWATIDILRKTEVGLVPLIVVKKLPNGELSDESFHVDLNAVGDIESYYE